LSEVDRPVDRPLCAVDRPVDRHTVLLICFFLKFFFLLQLDWILFDHHLFLKTRQFHKKSFMKPNNTLLPSLVLVENERFKKTFDGMEVNQCTRSSNQGRPPDCGIIQNTSPIPSRSRSVDGSLLQAKMHIRV